MTLPTITWRQGANYSSAAATTKAAIQSIRDAVNADAGLGGNWVVNYFNASDGVLELKLGGSPTGILASARVLIFGGNTPNAAALADSATPSATTIYCYLSLDAGTGAGGPTNLYSTADPYPTSTLKHRGSAVGVISALTSLYLVDSTEGIALILWDTNSQYSLIIGKLLDDNATGRWIKMSSNGANIVSPTAITANWFAPAGIGSLDTAAGMPIGVYIDEVGGVVYSLGRVFPDLSALTSLVSANLGAIFHPILMAARLRGTANVWSAVGWLRQIRYCPSLVDRSVVFSGGTPVGYVAAQGASAIPIVFDQVA